MAQNTANTTANIYEIGLYDPFFPPDAYLASVVAADEKATTYHLQCAHGGRSWSHCPLPMPATYINGPSTANLKLIYNRTQQATAMRTTVSNECQITPSASASCKLSKEVFTSIIPNTRRQGAVTTQTPTISKTSTTSRQEGSITTGALTVTAGKEKLEVSGTSSQAGSGITETSSGMGASGPTGAGIGIAAVGIAAAAFL